MLARTVLVALLAAIAEARFGQEQGNGAITAIGALTDLGSPGQAATLAGGSIQFLLAAANPCGKLTQADNIITELGTSDRAVSAARGLVAAEQNFNPFVVSIPSICSDPTLPKSPQLRGVVALIDPAVVGSDKENANAKASTTTPFNADGLSVAQVMIAQGFSNFTAVSVDGTKAAASSLGGAASGSSSGTSNSNSNSNSEASSSVAVATTAAAVASSPDCTPSTTMITVTRAAKATSSDCAAPVTVTVEASAAASAPPAPAASSAESKTTAAAASISTSPASSGAAGSCTGSGQTLVCTSPADGTGKVSDPKTGTFGGFVKSTIAGLDFGLCVPTMKFEAGLDGRASTASTFQAQDPLCNKGQEEALNPGIIANRIHDQLTNVCGANQAAKDAVAKAQTAIATLARDASTANAWNTMLGFDGTNINPDNAPQTGLVGHV